MSRAVNKPTDVEISKIDATTGKELKGAVLSLYDKDGNLKPHVFIAKLKAGATYKLVEDKAPAGYTKKVETVEFTVSDDGSVTKVSMEKNGVLIDKR